MAAFPPPQLQLHVPNLLRGLFRSCETNCVTACCGLQAFDVSRENVSAWVAQQPLAVAVTALDQFERLLGQIARHRGPIHADPDDGHFKAVWYSPYDCLAYFDDWRSAIADALCGLTDPPFFNPNWMTETVVALRDAIVAEKAFDRLPILADALEEAGCDNRHILDHLRGDDDHTHMCWVLDLLRVGDGQPVA